MPKSHFVTLIARLALGFLVLGLLSFFLFSRLRAPQNKKDPTPSDAPVAILTPSPTPVPSGLPDVAETDKPSEGSGKDGGVEEPKQLATPSTRRNPQQVTTITTRNGTTTVTSTSRSGSSSASAYASGSSAKAYSESRNGYASSSASASSW